LATIESVGTVGLQPRSHDYEAPLTGYVLLGNNFVRGLVVLHNAEPAAIP
jgi:hypothetical protein